MDRLGRRAWLTQAVLVTLRLWPCGAGGRFSRLSATLNPAHATDRHAIEMPLDEILAPERKRARNRMVLRAMVGELLKEWFRH